MKVLCILLVAYVGVYVILSMNGSYEPDAFSLRGVIDYEWAPRGFYAEHIQQNANGSRDHGGWKRIMLRTFLPLWYIDVNFIHKVSFDGRLPATP